MSITVQIQTVRSDRCATIAKQILFYPLCLTAHQSFFSYADVVESSPPDFVLPDDGADPTAPPWSKFCKWVLSNRSDPNQEHDKHSDCVAYHIHRGSISGGTDLEAAQKLDPILSTGEGLVASNKDCADGASQQDCKVDLPLKRCDGDTSMNSGVAYKGWKQTRSSGA
jgi:hypothetical protein